MESRGPSVGSTSTGSGSSSVTHHINHHQNHQQNQRSSKLSATGTGLTTSTPMSITTPNKPWSELKTVVNDLRRQLSSLSTMIPMNINFRTLSDGRTRIYFLSTPPSGWETTLLYADIPVEVAFNDGDDGTQRFGIFFLQTWS